MNEELNQLVLAIEVRKALNDIQIAKLGKSDIEAGFAGGYNSALNEILTIISVIAKSNK